jgi:hypothetical protein
LYVTSAESEVLGVVVVLDAQDAAQRLLGHPGQAALRRGQVVVAVDVLIRSGQRQVRLVLDDAERDAASEGVHQVLVSDVQSSIALAETVAPLWRPRRKLRLSSRP